MVMQGMTQSNPALSLWSLKECVSVDVRMSVNQDVSSSSNTQPKDTTPNNQDASSSSNKQPKDTTPQTQDARNTSTTQNDTTPKISKFASGISGCWKVCTGTCKCCLGICKIIEKFDKWIKIILFLGGLIIVIGLFWYFGSKILWLKAQVAKLWALWEGITSKFSGITTSLTNHASQLWNHGLQFDFQGLASGIQGTDEDSHINCSAWISTNVKSDQYLIDMDGRNDGLSPFKVFCDFDKNLTRISPKQIKINSNGSKTVDYEASMDQIRLLIYKSGKCYQEIKTDDVDDDGSTIQTWWMDFNEKKNNFSEGGIYDPEKQRIIAHWLLPITGLRRKVSTKDGTKIGVGDLVCSDTFGVDIQGPLKVNSSHWIVDRHLWTYNINFDFKIEEMENDKKNGMGKCLDVLYIKAENSSCFYPRIQYCPEGKHLQFTHFNEAQCATKSIVNVEYPLESISKDWMHLQYHQFKQKLDEKALFLIKLDGQVIVSNYTTNDDTAPKEVYFSNLSDSGFYISNLTISEK